jgi:hypothetical protein
MPGGQTKFQSENLMADVYLGIMIAGVNTLIVLGAAIAFVLIWKAASAGDLATLSRFFAIRRLCANGRMDQGRPRETRRRLPRFPWALPGESCILEWIGRSVEPANVTLIVWVKVQSSLPLRTTGITVQCYWRPSSATAAFLIYTKWPPMDYHTLTNESLAMMYFGARGALAADDELNRLGQESRFRVRATPAWKKHTADLEAVMLGRGMIFDLIEWSEDLWPGPDVCFSLEAFSRPHLPEKAFGSQLCLHLIHRNS